MCDFTDDGCMTIAGAHATVRYPGIADLSSVKMDKAVSSCRLGGNDVTIDVSIDVSLSLPHVY